MWYVTDQTGLFEKLTGALAVTGLNILGARNYPADELAIDVFYVEGENGGIVEDSTIRGFFEDTLESFLKGKDCPTEQISAHRKRRKNPKLFPQLINLVPPFPHKSMFTGIYHSGGPLWRYGQLIESVCFI